MILNIFIWKKEAKNNTFYLQIFLILQMNKVFKALQKGYCACRHNCCPWNILQSYNICTAQISWSAHVHCHGDMDNQLPKTLHFHIVFKSDILILYLT